MCGTYPRTHLCLGLSRDTAPSGFGPLRTTTSVRASLTHDLSEHSHVTFDAQYLHDSSGTFTSVAQAVLRNSKAFLASASYDRDLNQRISAGFGGRYRQRELDLFPSAHSYEASVHVKAKLGRI